MSMTLPHCLHTIGCGPLVDYKINLMDCDQNFLKDEVELKMVECTAHDIIFQSFFNTSISVSKTHIFVMWNVLFLIIQKVWKTALSSNLRLSAIHLPSSIFFLVHSSPDWPLCLPFNLPSTLASQDLCICDYLCFESSTLKYISFVSAQMSPSQTLLVLTTLSKITYHALHSLTSHPDPLYSASLYFWRLELKWSLTCYLCLMWFVSVLVVFLSTSKWTHHEFRTWFCSSL